MVRYTKKPMRGARKTTKKTALATKAYVKKHLEANTETKIVDWSKIETTSNTLGTPMFLDDIMSIGLGDRVSSRIGREVFARGIRFSFVLNNNATVGVLARVLFLVNKIGRNYTAYRAGTEIFDDNVSNDSTTGTLYDMTRRINKDRYRVLSDKIYKLGSSAADGSNFLQKKLWLPMKNKLIYDNTTAASVPELNNVIALVLVARADNDVSLGDVVECTMHSSFYYKDS